MPRRLSVLLLILAAVTPFAGPIGTASAEIITIYDNRANFEAATAVGGRIDFEGLANPGTSRAFPPAPDDTPGVLTIGDTTFASSYINVTSSTYYEPGTGPFYDLGSGDFLQAYGTIPASLQITLAGSHNAVGFDLETFDVGVSEVRVIANGDVAGAFFVSAPYLSPRFVGFASSDAITSLSLEITTGDNQGVVNLDSFTYGSVQAVPEPSAIVMVATAAVAMLGIGSHRRRRARAAAWCLAEPALQNGSRRTPCGDRS